MVVIIETDMSIKGTILLTGAGGMVGRNLLESSKALLWQFITPSRSELDLTQTSQVFDFVKKVKPDLIIHAAGLVGGIQANMKAPVDFLITNMDLAKNVILAARQADVPRLLNLGSSCMYPRAVSNPLSEEMILTGALEPTNEGYALAKIVAARLCEYISRENLGHQYKTVIPCNLYGRYDKFDPERSHMLPAIINKIHRAKINKEESVEIWGDGSARREFLYGGDLADAIFFLLDRFEQCPTLTNIGLGTDYTVDEYYQTTAEVIGYVGDFNHDLSKPVGMRQKLVSTSTQEKMGWSPSTNLFDGIKLTYEYYLQEYCS